MGYGFVVIVEVSREQIELALDRLWWHGADAIAEDDVRQGPADGAVGSTVQLTASFPDHVAAQGAADDLTTFLDGHHGSIDVHEIVDGGWLDAWRPYATATRTGRLVVVPDWVDAAPAAPDDVVVRLEPHHAFGSGSHASTALVAAELERHVQPGDAVLDVGCGSGVLAVAAALLGAALVVATDIDEHAVTTTVENAARNGVGDRVAASTTALAEVTGGPFAIVAANIGRNVLVELARDLLSVTAPGGLLLLSGLLDGQGDAVLAAVTAAAANAGATVGLVERPARDGWEALVLRRTTPET